MLRAGPGGKRSQITLFGPMNDDAVDPANSPTVRHHGGETGSTASWPRPRQNFPAVSVSQVRGLRIRRPSRTSELPKVDESIGFHLQQVGPRQALNLDLRILDVLIALR